MKTVRIGCGQGFWGDSLEAPIELLRDGDLDYLVLDYLAEVTMSILAKQRQRDTSLGYARDFLGCVERALPFLTRRGSKIIANAGGVNPRGCAEAVVQLLAQAGLDKKIRVAVVEGDDLFPNLKQLIDSGEQLSHLETGASIQGILSQVQSANAYIGAESVVAALRDGAQIVVTGRVADPSLVLAPLLYEFSWADDDWDRRAAGIVAGHIIECGAQCTGGNCSYNWQSIPLMESIGYPIVEVREDGSFLVTKAQKSGGRVDSFSVKEQLVYEIGDPKRYITPDVIADFTSLGLKELGENVVEVSGVRGAPRPEHLKVSLCYSYGFKSAGTLLYTWPDAYAKAVHAGEVLRKRLERLGTIPKRFLCEYIGAGAAHAGIAPKGIAENAEEVQLRIAVWDLDRKVVERFSREMTPLVLNGPPGATAYAGARGQIEEVFAYWPSLVSRDKVKITHSMVS